MWSGYFYPRPPRGGRHQKRQLLPEPERISIHALREEGDPENVVISKMPEISIHALCEEGDGAGLLLSTCKQLFLSTPSARRATTKAVNVSPKNMRISIHALCEEGDSP